MSDGGVRVEVVTVAVDDSWSGCGSSRTRGPTCVLSSHDGAPSTPTPQERNTTGPVGA